MELVGKISSVEDAKLALESHCTYREVYEEMTAELGAIDDAGLELEEDRRGVSMKGKGKGKGTNSQSEKKVAKGRGDKKAEKKSAGYNMSGEDFPVLGEVKVKSKKGRGRREAQEAEKIAAEADKIESEFQPEEVASTEEPTGAIKEAACADEPAAAFEDEASTEEPTGTIEEEACADEPAAAIKEEACGDEPAATNEEEACADIGVDEESPTNELESPKSPDSHVMDAA